MEHSTEECECKGKLCRDCEQIKCIGCFPVHKRRNGKSYHDSYCKPCNNQRNYAWAKANPDKMRAAQRLSHNKTPSATSERMKQVRRKNAAKWNKAHPQQARLHRKNWNKTHPEHVSALAHRLRAERLQAEGSYTTKEWSKLKAKYNYTCLCCGR